MPNSVIALEFMIKIVIMKFLIIVPENEQRNMKEYLSIVS